MCNKITASVLLLAMASCHSQKSSRTTQTCSIERDSVARTRVMEKMSDTALSCIALNFDTIAVELARPEFSLKIKAVKGELTTIGRAQHSECRMVETEDSVTAKISKNSLQNSSSVSKPRTPATAKWFAFAFALVCGVVLWRKFR